MSFKISRQPLTLCLSAAILIKSGKCLAADDDFLGYRKEFYREDDHRMSIDTDSLAFDVGLGAHVRFTGNLVNDAISGATPIGSPTPSQWPQATFAGLYPSTYTSAYNGIVSSATDPNSPTSLFPLYQAGLLPGVTTLQQFTNYVVSTGYAQYGPTGNSVAADAGSSATNAVKQTLAAQSASIANSPYFRSANKVPTVELHDRRQAYSIAAPLTWGIHELTPQYSYSTEHDYHSEGAALNYTLSLNQKNTLISAGWSHNADRVLDYADASWDGKISDDILIGLNQLLTPKSYFTIDLTYGQEYGYLDDPYRQVMFAAPPQTDFSNPSTAGENRPRRRTKEIFYASYTQFFDPVNGSMDLGYRFFHDSFGIFAHTAEAAWHQKLGKYVVFTPSLRYYYQTAAKFYYILVPVDSNGNPVQYYSSDYRLSELNTWTVSGAVTFRVHKHVSLDLSYMRYVMQGLDGLTSQSAYPTANVYSVGARIWF